LSTLRTVVVTAERRRDEARNTHLTRVGGLLAAIALVFTFIFGVYGSNAGPYGTKPVVTLTLGYLAFVVAVVALVYLIGWSTAGTGTGGDRSSSTRARADPGHVVGPESIIESGPGPLSTAVLRELVTRDS